MTKVIQANTTQFVLQFQQRIQEEHYYNLFVSRYEYFVDVWNFILRGGRMGLNTA